MTECCCCDDSSSDSWGEEDDRDANLRVRKFKANFFLTPEQVIELDKCKRGVNLLFNIEIDDSDDETRKQVELTQILDFYEKYWTFHGKELPAIEWDPFGRPYGIDACGRLYGYDQMGLPFGYDECGIPFGYDRFGKPFGRRTYGLPRIPVNLKAGAGKYYKDDISPSSSKSDSKSPSHSPTSRKSPPRNRVRPISRSPPRSRSFSRSPSPTSIRPHRKSPKYSSTSLYPDRPKSRLFKRRRKQANESDEERGINKKEVKKGKRDDKPSSSRNHPSKRDAKLTQSASSSDVLSGKKDTRAKEKLARNMESAINERRRNKKKTKKKKFCFK